MAVQAYNLKAEAFAKAKALEGAADEGGARQHDDLDQIQVFRMNIGVGEFEIGLDFDARGVLGLENLFAAAFDQKDVVGEDAQTGAGGQIFGLVANHADDGQIQIVAEVGFGESF